MIVKERKLNRLKGYNYSHAGMYFVTICAHNRECLFGIIENSQMGLNECGHVVDECWRTLSKHFVNADIDEYVIMPNHIHGIVTVGDADLRPLHSPCDRTKMKLSKIIHGFKSSVTRIIHRKSDNINFVWHRSFYDHIIRNDKSLNNIREYIKNNPLKWEFDIENKINNNKEIKDYYKKLF